MTQRIKSREQAEGYLALVCFKHGPPALHGLELEWTVHHAADPSRPLDAHLLWQAMGSLAPPTITPYSAAGSLPAGSLPAGSRLTVEPGGQLEISTSPSSSVSDQLTAARCDAAFLRSILFDRGFTLGGQATDPVRPLRRVLHTPRYEALEAAFDQVGPLGRQMMTSTASVQVCVDAGEQADLVARWTAVHAVGPAMVALFANSPCLEGERTGWVSSRLRAVLGMSPRSTTPPVDTRDPVGHWTRLALDAPLVAIRRPDRPWVPPAGMTFADWIVASAGDHGPAPTYDDLDYHLTTLFPVVRPRGYLEVRYLDQQAGDGWAVPFVLLTALLSTPHTVDLAIAASEPGVGRWQSAARLGLADPLVARATADVVEVGLAAMGDLDLVPDDAAEVTERLQRGAHRAMRGSTFGATAEGALAGRESW